jgi:hypothetical protein
VKTAEKEKLLEEFKRWFFDLGVEKADKELLEYYGGESYGWNFFIAYCAGYAEGKKEAGK